MKKSDVLRLFALLGFAGGLYLGEFWVSFFVAGAFFLLSFSVESAEKDRRVKMVREEWEAFRVRKEEEWREFYDKKERTQDEISIWKQNRELETKLLEVRLRNNR